MAFKKGDDPNRHRFTAEELARAAAKGKKNLRPFRKGPDPRRHKFSRDECRRGGYAAWRRTMVEVRAAMNLPIPESLVSEFPDVAGPGYADDAIPF